MDSKEEVWQLAADLMSAALQAVRRIDDLAPGFPEELYEAKDPDTDMQVVDFIERLARHGLHHRHELAAVRAAIGRSRPTDPGDDDPTTGEPYARTWYQWFLLETFLRRAELVGELIGLSDADLDKKPSPELVAGNERSVREICEHVLQAQDWKMRSIENGLSAFRKRKSTEKTEN